MDLRLFLGRLRDFLRLLGDFRTWETLFLFSYFRELLDLGYFLALGDAYEGHWVWEILEPGNPLATSWTWGDIGT
jgi:hypothetical protein